MKKITITLFVVFCSMIAYSQPLSKAAINDFATQAFLKYRYGDGTFFAFCTFTLTRKQYSQSEAAVIMESLKTNSKGREAILEGIANISGDQTSLFRNFYAMHMTAKNATELANYVYAKYNKSRVEESN